MQLNKISELLRPLSILLLLPIFVLVTSSCDQSKVKPEKNQKSHSSEILSESQKLIADFNKFKLDHKDALPPMYLVLYTGSKDGSREYFLLNEYRTRSGIRTSEDYYGPFTYEEVLGLYSAEHYRNIVSAGSGFVQGMQINGIQVTALTTEERHKLLDDLD